LLAQQLARALDGIPRRRLRAIVIAHEPVWAISTTPGARPDTPDNATRRAIYIRKLLVKLLGPSVADTIRVIYGGSATAKNASSFLARDIRGMEGLLVGAASLHAEDFIGTVRAVAESQHSRI
jgi:triosephosphate isomerase